MPTSPEFRLLLDTVVAAGRVAMAHFERIAPAEDAASSGAAYATKSASIDLVTAADREVEAFITAALRRAHPGDALLAEETAALLPGGPDALARPPDRLWVLDPIDGTTNFAHGFPQFSISLAFWKGGRAEAAAVFNPATGELFAAERGGGAHLNGRPLRVSAVDAVARALLVTGYAYDRRERPEFYLAITRRILMNAHGVRRLGSAALDLCWVAAGRLEAHVECRLQPWDMAAGRLVLEEAGGRVSDFKGAPIGLASPEMIGSNGHLHDELVELFRPHADGAVPQF